MTLNQEYFQNLLRELLEKGRRKNPSYSVRALSKKIGISHSALSEILNGKRKIGPKLASRLADSMMLPPEIRERVFSIDHRKSSQLQKEAKRYFILQADRYKVIADWYHFAILSLAETKAFKSEVGWIANRLEITKLETHTAIDRLVRLCSEEWPRDGTNSSKSIETPLIAFEIIAGTVIQVPGVFDQYDSPLGRISPSM